jgi:peptidoglycan/xylan/chitin deacetylase (PgdA/CDA1 family)
MYNKTVILTFDDAVSNHCTFVAPLLKKLGFNATFFVCEFPPDFATDKVQYMSWEQIEELDNMGFEVANHTLTHTGLGNITPGEFEKQLLDLEALFRSHGIPKSENFAYPGGPGAAYAAPILQKHGFKTARTVRSAAWNVVMDDCWLVPSIPVHGPDDSALKKALDLATTDEIPVLLYHGVPDILHTWVDTPPEIFEREMRYLAAEEWTVLALRDITNLW